MAPRILEFDASSLTPLSIASLCSRCSHVHSRRCQNAFNNLNLSIRPNFREFRFRTEFNCSDSRRIFEISRGFTVKRSRRVITDLAGAEQPEQFDEFGITDEEVNRDTRSSLEDSNSELRQKRSQLRRRVIFGLAIGLSGGGVVLAGGWVFTLAISVAAFVASREYFELVRSHGIASGMTPPPRYVSRACSVVCCLMPLFTLYMGNIDVSVTSSAFVVAMALLLQRGIPRFAQLSSTMFGLFYCGYLPCFWVKLRCGLAAPALNTRVGASWPLLLGGQAQWTVGLVATLISISSIIAADTYAFFGGKAFGRTPLTAISPKKTWEGALVGLGGCVATSVLLAKILCWPTSTLSSTAFGILIFFGSIFGDLTESMIKRDAGVKDSGSLILNDYFGSFLGFTSLFSSCVLFLAALLKFQLVNIVPWSYFYVLFGVTEVGYWIDLTATSSQERWLTHS